MPILFVSAMGGEWDRVGCEACFADLSGSQKISCISECGVSPSENFIIFFISGIVFFLYMMYNIYRLYRRSS